LIKVKSASVAFAGVVWGNSDRYPFSSSLPFILGSDVAGLIEAGGRA
jgi:NADPH:quinone reductase-like Zn-dependent oxidoreductase